MTKKVIILSGYARSGKTTFLNVAKDLGCETVSTSAILHEFTKRLARYVLGINNLDTTDKRYPKILQYAFRQNGGKLLHNIVSHTSRDLLITVAEKCLVPVFGRDVFGLATAKRIKRSSADVAIYEAFNREECDAMLHFLDLQEGDYELYMMTVRSPKEQGGVDKRDLLHGEYPTLMQHDDVIENDGTIEDYKYTVKEYIEWVQRSHSAM